MLPRSRIPIILSWLRQPGPHEFQFVRAWRARVTSPRQLQKNIAGNIYFLIRSYLEEHRGGKVLIGPLEVRLPDEKVYEPDLLFIANSRKAILTPIKVEGAPNLIVEVLSPRTAKLDKGAKRVVYARAGVEELWIVDPEAKRVHVYRLRESAETPVATYGVRGKIESQIFPGLKIPVAKVFQQ